MGEVFAAKDLLLGRTVALKFLFAFPDEATRRQLLTEGRALAELKGDHVLHVIDVGEIAEAAVYLVTELLDGQPLDQHIARRGGRLPCEDAVGMIIEACAGLAEPHALGRVHRDLKPGNLFLEYRRDGTTRLKVCDFGLAISAPAARTEAPSGVEIAVAGTPPYMSPEQISEPSSVDSRTDVWALGVVLYELLTGTVPFGGQTVAAVLAAVLGRQPVNVAHWRAGLDPELVSLVARCLEKDPARRVPDVGTLALALAPFGDLAHRALAIAAARTLLLARCESLIAQGAFSEAISAGEALLAHDPRSHELRQRMALAHAARALKHAAQEEIGPAMSDVDRAIELDPDVPELHELRARLARRAGDLGKAVTSFVERIARDPMNSVGMRFSAIQAHERGEIARAIVLMTHAIEVVGDRHAHFERGCMHADNGNLEAALADFDAAIAHEPTHETARAWRGVVLARLGEHDRALADIEAARAAGSDPYLHFLHAFARAHLGDREALPQLEALDRDPGLRIARHEFLEARAVALALEGEDARARYDLAEAARLRQEHRRRLPPTR